MAPACYLCVRSWPTLWLHFTLCWSKQFRIPYRQYTLCFLHLWLWPWIQVAYLKASKRSTGSFPSINQLVKVVSETFCRVYANLNWSLGYGALSCVYTDGHDETGILSAFLHASKNPDTYPCPHGFQTREPCSQCVMQDRVGVGTNGNLSSLNEVSLMLSFVLMVLNLEWVDFYLLTNKPTTFNYNSHFLTNAFRHNWTIISVWLQMLDHLIPNIQTFHNSRPIIS
jgi:hypothetical protein